MKTNKVYPVILLLIFCMVGTSVEISAQVRNGDKRSKKEERRAKAEYSFRTLDSLMSSGRYVLEASYLQNKYGTMLPVSSNINFIRVNGPNGILQTGNDLREGYNGIGGVTAEGKINNYEIKRDPKRLTISVTYHLFTNIGTYDIIMNVGSDNVASATISGSTSGRLTWRGQIVPLNKSKTFKGQTTY
jgi:hypothetical protein